MIEILLITLDIDTSYHIEAGTRRVSPMGMRTCVSGSKSTGVESCFPSQGFPNGVSHAVQQRF